MSKRAEVRIARKKKVLASGDYKEWWANRSQHDPVPSDPYRAFMIDLSLSAKVTNRPEWENKPNRSDVLDVDYPDPSGRTGPPRRRRGRSAYRHDAIEGKLPFEAQVEALQIQQLETKHGLKKRVIFSPSKEGPLRSAALVGVGKDLFSGALVLRGTPEVFLGVAGKSKAQRRAANLHEMGHVMHGQLSHGSKADFEKLKKLGVSKKFGQDRYFDEQAAWKLANPAMRLLPKGQRAEAFWLQGYALMTYRKGRKSSKKVGQTVFESW